MVFIKVEILMMREWGLNTCNHLYQVTDGNYTVAWLVADENDGAGYYEDDEDDQVRAEGASNDVIYVFCL